MNDRKTNPPRLLTAFLQWFCPDHLLEEIEGDLAEKFERDIKRVGVTRAKKRFVWNTIRFFRPEIILRNKFSDPILNTIMLRNYFTIALRNVAKNKVFSAINIFGLSIGLAACLLIFQFVSFELSYDKFHDKFDRIYRITNDRFQNGKLIQHGTITYPTIGPTMAKDYPEVEMYTRIFPSGELTVIVDNKPFREDYCHLVDEYFLSVFDFPLLAGDRTTALKDPYTIVLTESLANKYFDVTDRDYGALIGKVLYWDLNPRPYKITGVCRDVPDNSHIQFDALVSYATLIEQNGVVADINWRWSDFRHYLVLKPGVDYKSFEKKFDKFSERYFQGDRVSGSVEKFYLQPLRDAHLYSDYEYDIAKTSSGKAVWTMLIAAVFILVIAWINYINLTTARALDRAKEVGLRKVMGALKEQLIKQFMFESVLISLVGFVIAIVITSAGQAAFNDVIGANTTLWKVVQNLEPSAAAGLAVVISAGVILSGFYPAFILSSYKPVTVLKGKFDRSGRGQLLRKGLVVFQFTASVALITGTLIVSRQLQYMNEADLGMNIENILVVRAPLANWDSTYITRIESYKHELSQINGVTSVATSSRLPGDRLGRAFNLRLTDDSSTAHYTTSFFGVDYGFFDTYGISLIAGRRFAPSDHKVDFDDINVAVLNMNALSLFGITSPDEAIGKEILSGDNLRWKIIGVVNDFHQESLKKPKEPIVFLPTYNTSGPTSIRYREQDPALIREVETVYRKFFEDSAFSYVFLEDSYRSQYNDEERFAKVILIFTILGIIISCLGLIGLSSYTAVQRTKEIGIRKALGASLANIVSLLSAGFMKLVIIAILVALPLAYLALDKWLANYPYRISLEWFLFVIPALLILLIAALTISFQILKTARTNPANTLKYE